MERRRTFSREFKLKAVKLVTERGVAVAQAAKDLDVHENVLRKWVRGETPRGLAGQSDVRGARCLAEWLLRVAHTAQEPAQPQR